MFDVRSGETVQSALLPLDDDSGSSAKWWTVAAVAVAGVGLWLWFR
jgi:hypothetical protein